MLFALPGGGAELLALARCELCAAAAPERRDRLAKGRMFHLRRFASLPCEPIRCFNLRVLGGSNTPPLDVFNLCVMSDATADAVSSPSFRRETTKASKLLETPRELAWTPFIWGTFPDYFFVLFWAPLLFFLPWWQLSWSYNKLWHGSMSSLLCCRCFYPDCELVVGCVFTLLNVRDEREGVVTEIPVHVRWCLVLFREADRGRCWQVGSWGSTPEPDMTG